MKVVSFIVGLSMVLYVWIMMLKNPLNLENINLFVLQYVYGERTSRHSLVFSVMYQEWHSNNDNKLYVTIVNICGEMQSKLYTWFIFQIKMSQISHYLYITTLLPKSLENLSHSSVKLIILNSSRDMWNINKRICQTYILYIWHELWNI